MLLAVALQSFPMPKEVAHARTTTRPSSFQVDVAPASHAASPRWAKCRCARRDRRHSSSASCSRLSSNGVLEQVPRRRLAR
jgi:hypothetical protein